jgi:hypothetical protein
MPAMPRINNKCKKIAYSILGEPPALAARKNKKDREIDKYILASCIQTAFRYRL